MKKLPVGTKVLAPYKYDTALKEGVVRDSLSTMVYIEFRDGTEDFCANTDSRLKQIVKYAPVRKGRNARATVPHVNKKREAKKNGALTEEL